MWTKENMPDLTGKTAIVTGANTGIGYETAKALYEKGANVTIAARDQNKIEVAIEKITSSTKGNGSLEIGILNLAHTTQIKSFADGFKNRHSKLDILVNNAGVMIPPASKTDKGYELQFGVNFLGHFALTGHLFPLLKKASNARVVTLSSGAATLTDNIDFDNLKLEKPYNAWQSYAISKLADILFTYELDRKIKAADLKMISAASHPGVTRTDLQRHIPGEQLEGMFAEFDEVMQPWQGALPSLFAATDASVMGGEFYGPDGANEYSGYPALSKHSTRAMNDKELAKQLWKYAESESGVRFEI
ncbi:oxidoreductase [Adhaeribacter radiodurans]|uniref:SDR family NAD(P)-dependent oxidoreductase n=1 Tax=Adhaeribacter radiodurans TaxID=2745197 RepID=A0A7L7L1D9_9BACT|nr:oxidoreductase [Adhaeribacter radiodurans]QMU26590.1 SDR family NAD(P)-dependent oxidoreductase [Adhaeribacter radiodurans]